MKLYVVLASSGSWDNYSEWIHSIHTSQDMATQYANSINDEWQKKKEIKCPFPVDEDMDLIDEERYSKEEKEIYCDWHNDWRNSAEWNGAEVKEYETDKIYDNS